VSKADILIVEDDQTISRFLELELQQTGREYGHRDLCVFFGFQDAAQSVGRVVRQMIGQRQIEPIGSFHAGV
jgi:hypothetical protein